MFWIYTLLAHLAFLLLLPMLLLHPKLKEGFWARLGRIPGGWPGLDGEGSRIWLHGASAGDLLALAPLIRALKQALPDCHVVLTTVTRSGMALAEKGIEGVDAVAYLPYDLPWAVKPFIRAIRPEVLVLEYAEIWPTLIRRCKARGCRIVLNNGRFHPDKLRSYRFFYRLVGNPLRKLDLLCMRSEAEAKHARAIGAPAERLRVTGNTKFDSLGTPDGEALAKLRTMIGEGDWWVAGSTHEGEEGPLLQVYSSLRTENPSLRLLLAPRYPERVPRLMKLAGSQGLESARRSAGASDAPVVFLDTVGELAAAYGLARVVFVGGSFVPRGGQNILEPAAWGKPVLFGPHMDNFEDSVELLRGRGGEQVDDFRALQTVLARLLADERERARLGARAREAVAGLRGASRENARCVAALLRGEELP